MEVCGSQEYMQALEEELNKITLFQKELPLSLQLVTQAIDACRRQMATERTDSGSESVETSSEGGRLLEEFIPIRRDSGSQQEQDHKEADKSDGSDHRDKKTDWLRSVQLWSQEAEASADEVVDSSEKRSSTSTKKRAASAPSCNEKRSPSDIAVGMADHGGASAAARSSNGGDDKEGQLQKKARRSWSPELHRRFLLALQQLGGPHAATPKHIRQLMKVDGLTNDEIKSHLQKYRLHTTRAGSPSSPISNSQSTQIVVVSGIWAVPELTAAAVSRGRTSEDAAATIYTTVTTTSTTAPPIAPETPLRPWFPKTRK